LEITYLMNSLIHALYNIWGILILTWITFLFIIKGLIATFPSSQHIKHLIATAGVVLTAGTFAFFARSIFNVNNGFFYLMLANCICIAGGSYFYKLEITPEDMQ
jgi:hypothetical protein